MLLRERKETISLIDGVSVDIIQMSPADNARVVALFGRIGLPPQSISKDVSTEESSAEMMSYIMRLIGTDGVVDLAQALFSRYVKKLDGVFIETDGQSAPQRPATVEEAIKFPAMTMPMVIAMIHLMRISNLDSQALGN